MKSIFFHTTCLFLLLFAACKKDSFITGKAAQLSLSSDTLHFDTVFATMGSVTGFFKITNTNNQKLHIDKVALTGGTASAFSINVDGSTGPLVKDITLDAHDSIFVFVKLSVNPSALALPFILRDSIGIAFNGNTRWVQLDGWGRNAHFLRNAVIGGNASWSNDLPYVILGGLRIDSNASLTLLPGCRVYLHADAPLLVDGTLQVNGGKSDSARVYFSGDRMDYPYNEYPAAWPGIYMRTSSKNNLLQYAVIRNAYQGLVVQNPAPNGGTKLTLNECIIDNIYDAGLLGIGTSINARNCLISNCGKNLQLLYGGNYRFVHCTMPTIGNSYIAHKDPVLYISNGIRSGGTLYTGDMYAGFINCIIWAQNSTAENEVVSAKQGSGAFNVNFTNCLWKVKTNPADLASAANIINNQDPLFDSIDLNRHYFSFRLKAASPAINKGVDAGVSSDLDGNPRPVGLPDLGAYEQQ